ncbi:hypothetical protein Droror1_Dr00002917 [Drosera rotundifolia]
MATHRSTRINYNYLITVPSPASSTAAPPVELDESDVVWSSTDSIRHHRSPGSKKITSEKNQEKKKTMKKENKIGGLKPSSLPVNVPDWSKILRSEYKENRWPTDFDDDDGGDEEEEENRVPPHEYLARTRMASLSVHEGVGRTLKGRDLSRVRNAVWEKIGFID